MSKWGDVRMDFDEMKLDAAARARLLRLQQPVVREDYAATLRQLVLKRQQARRREAGVLLLVIVGLACMIWGLGWG